MENILSLFSNEENKLESEKLLNIDVIEEAFTDVINTYHSFLREIIGRIVDETTDDLNREIRKFNAVKKELLEFLIKHKQFFKLRMITVMSKGTALFSLDKP